MTTTMRETFVDTAAALLDDDPRVAVLLAGISVDAFAPAAARHPDRVVNLGIREQLLVGAAGGMALAGMRPIAHTYAPFLVERAFEQVKLDLGHQDVDAVLVSVGASHDWAEGGATHRAPADVALLDTLAGWSVHLPGHPDEVPGLLRQAVRGGRHYLRLTTTANAAPAPRPGLRVVRRGSERAVGTVLAVGPMLDRALAAVAGLDVTVLHAVTVRPLDPEPLLDTLATPAVVLVEPTLAGTSAAAVGRLLGRLPHRLLGLGVAREELRHYGDPAEHDRAHGLDVAGIARSVTEFVSAQP
jgi:transketolase